MPFIEKLEKSGGEGSTREEVIGELAGKAYSELWASSLFQRTDFLVLSVPSELNLGEITKEDLWQALGEVCYLRLFNEECDAEEDTEEDTGERFQAATRNCSALAIEDKIYLFFTEEACKRESGNLDLKQAVFVEYSKRILVSQN